MQERKQGTSEVSVQKNSKELGKNVLKKSSKELVKKVGKKRSKELGKCACMESTNYQVRKYAR